MIEIINNTRQAEFDILKGLGILFVILGHSVPDFPVNLRADIWSSNLGKVMYTFHMPLFFICAGCMVKVSENRLIANRGVFNVP